MPGPVQNGADGTIRKILWYRLMSLPPQTGETPIRSAPLEPWPTEKPQERSRQNRVREEAQKGLLSYSRSLVPRVSVEHCDPPAPAEGRTRRSAELRGQRRRIQCAMRRYGDVDLRPKGLVSSPKLNDD